MDHHLQLLMLHSIENYEKLIYEVNEEGQVLLNGLTEEAALELTNEMYNNREELNTIVTFIYDSLNPEASISELIGIIKLKSHVPVIALMILKVFFDCSVGEASLLYQEYGC